MKHQTNQIQIQWDSTSILCTEHRCCQSSFWSYWAQSWMGHPSDTGYSNGSIIPASWYLFCPPRKDDRLSRPHLVLIKWMVAGAQRASCRYLARGGRVQDQKGGRQRQRPPTCRRWLSDHPMIYLFTFYHLHSRHVLFVTYEIERFRKYIDDFRTLFVCLLHCILLY